MSLDITNKLARGAQFGHVEGAHLGPAGCPPTDPLTELAPTPPAPTIDYHGRRDGDTMVLQSDSDHDPSVPPRIDRVIAGRYCLERELGRGGFGVVCLAYDRELDRQVAIKIARRTPGRGVDQLLEEGRKVAQLDHPNIVPVFDCGRFDDRTIYIVSKYVDGGSLARRMSLRRLSIGEAVRIAGEVAEALAHAHERGLIHRDLKPSNILLDARDRAHVTDFGLALRETDRADLVCYEGSPLYMSPEQAGGKSRMVDRRTDVFSFGVILYEMLTGHRPFPARSADEFRHQVSHDEPIPPRQLNPEIAGRLEQICLKALAKEPADRHASAWELARDLREAEPAPPTPRPLRHPLSRCLLAVAALLLLAAALAWALVPRPTPPRSPAATPAATTLDFQVAEWVLERGGMVDFVTYPPKISERSQLPREPATLRAVMLYRVRPLSRDDIGRLAALPDLRYLHLSDTNLAEEHLDAIAGMTGLEMLWLSWNPLTDRGIAKLGALKDLWWLNLEETQITDSGVEAISAARKLQTLDLSGTRVTDAGIRHLSGLPALTELRLNRTEVTDACVDDLLRLKRLDTLQVAGTALTPDAIRALKQGMPACTIVY